MKNIFSLILFASLLATGCNARLASQSAPTSTAEIATATLPPIESAAPSRTPVPTSAQPTAPPIEGTTSTQVNVRSDPSTAGSVLGILPANTNVQIVGRDPGGNWWQILYPQGADGKGWVTAQYVTTADPSLVPVIGLAGETGAPGGSIAIAQLQINVRSGPGTGFNSLGTLNPEDVVSLIGKDANGTWLQIAYPPGPEGKGWVNAAFVQAQGVESLPILTEAGQAIGTGTPTEIPATPTPTLVPAVTDNDSAENPIVSVTFAPSGTHTLIYNGDVSSPAGDREDWIRFVPFSRQVVLEISCSSGDLAIEITSNAQRSSASSECAGQQVLTVEPNLAVVIHVQSRVQNRQSYTSYTIKVKSIP